MQMLKTPELIKDPNILRKLLAAKYFFSPEDYFINITDTFLLKKKSKLLSTYNEVILLSDPFDYLKRQYTIAETTERIPKLTEYYHTYQLFFCRPLLNNWPNCYVLKRHFDKKAEVFYMNNYYSKNDGIVSFERNAYLDEESSVSNNMTNTRTIFNAKIKEQINNIKDIDSNDMRNNIVLISTISFENNNLNTLNSSYDLYSRKSPAESLGNIVEAFKEENGKVIPPLIKKKIIQFNKKVIKPISNCKETDKEKEKEKGKDKEGDKSSGQPKKHYLYNCKSNLIEFTQNKPPLFISAKSQSKKNILVKSSRNNENISSFINNNNNNSNKPKDNKTYDSKYAQIAKLSKLTTMKPNHINPNRDNSNSNTIHKKQPTRNSNISLSSISNIFNISQKSLNGHYANTKTLNQKPNLSTCSSLINIKKNEGIIHQHYQYKKAKSPKLIIQSSFSPKDNFRFSRNKKKEQYTQSIIVKNMTTLLSKERKRKSNGKYSVNHSCCNGIGNCNSNSLTHNKVTKSVDSNGETPNLKSSFFIGVNTNTHNNNNNNYKYSIREISKNKKTKYPMTLKLSNQLDTLLKYSKGSAKPSLLKYHNSNNSNNKKY